MLCANVAYSMMDGQTDCQILTLTMKGSHVASWLNSAQWFVRDSLMDRFTEAKWTDAGHKNNVALAHP